MIKFYKRSYGLSAVGGSVNFERNSHDLTDNLANV